MNIHVTQSAEGLPRRAFTVADAYRLVETGIIGHDERFELIGGEIVPMSPKNIRHERLKGWLNLYLAKTLDDTGVTHIQETTFVLSKTTFVEPDFVLYPTDPGLEALSPETALLAIEVSETSLSYDRGRKAMVYAAHGVRELWVIDARTLTTIVHRDPSPTGYASTAEIGEERTVTAAHVDVLKLNLRDYS